ncbi:MAG: hypothetical protein K6F37_07065 [Lachnospiraceae bacterium]|nr:hypothetical protein [Lachnospiraceae bacterium]
MKNKKILAVLGVAAVAALASGCGNDSNSDNGGHDVEVKESFEKDTQETEIVLETETEYDAATEIPMLVYGPPETFEDDDAEISDTEDINADDSDKD